MTFPSVTSETCCPTIRISGTGSGNVNDVYGITSRILNGRPTYIDYQNKHGIWYEGTHWMIGDYAGIDKGMANYGFISNEENTMCPSHLTQWKEVRFGQWVNVDAHFSCVGM